MSKAILNRISICACTLLLVLLSTARARALETEYLQQTGDSANRIDWIIMGDGYRAEDQAKFTQDATNVFNEFMNESVYSAYRSFYNVKLVHVISNETGADYGTDGGLRDTALGATFFCDGVTERLLCVNDSAVLQVAMNDAPEADIILVVVNDTKYGGAGGGFLATTSINPAAPLIAVHEMGHSLFGLADEYVDTAFSYPSCDPNFDCPERNVTLFYQRDVLKWGPWVEPSTPLPTPDIPEYGSVVGAFEGARYLPTGIYRPQSVCAMRALGAHFCAVCQETGVLRTYSVVDSIDAWSPEGDVTLEAGQSAIFSVSGPKPSPDTISFTWQIDGQTIAVNDTGSLELTSGDFGAGVHTLTVVAHDDTAMVRQDDDAVLTSLHSWQVTAAGEPAGAACVLGKQNLTIRDRGRVTSDIHGGTFSVALDARIDGSAFSAGNGSLGDRSVITRNATLQGVLQGNRPGVLGTLRENASVTLPSLVERTFQVGSGTQSVGSVTLNPDNRGNMTFRSRSRVTLNPGTFNFASLTIEPYVVVKANGAVQINVQGPLNVGNTVRFEAGAPESLVLYTNGTAQIGTELTMTGLVIAPKGAANFGARARLSGCVGALNVSIDPDAIMNSMGATLPTQTAPGGVSAQLNVTTDWISGYCVTLRVTNGATQPTRNWNVVVNTNQSAIYTSWNGTFSGSSGVISIAPGYEWNQVIQPGTTNDSVGFCANRNVPGSGTLSSIVSASASY